MGQAGHSGASGWQASAIRRAARYTIEGLVVEIGADDNFEHLRDGDFSGGVIGLVSRAPAHTPRHPIAKSVRVRHTGRASSSKDDDQRGSDDPEDRRDDRDQRPG